VRVHYSSGLASSQAQATGLAKSIWWPTCQNRGPPWLSGRWRPVDSGKPTVEDGGGEGREHSGVVVNLFWGLEGRWLTGDWLPMVTQLDRRGTTTMGRRRGRGSRRGGR
jgi:hypothetical protein